MMNLAIGTAQFGSDYGITNQDGLISYENGKEIINFCYDNGIDTIDTAVLYGNSETNLGNIGVEKFKVITKIPSIPNNFSDVSNLIKKIVESSKEKLKLQEIHTVLLHNPSDLFKPFGNEIYQSLLDLKKSGMISKIGISSYSVDEIRSLINLFSFDVVQTPLNIIDRSLLESNLINELNKKKIEIHIRSIFLQGVLLLPKNKIPQQFHGWNDIWNDWHEWLEINHIDPVHACLSYAKSIKGIDKIVIGVDSLSQIKKIINFYNINLIHEFPNISSTDKSLINPSKWKKT